MKGSKVTCEEKLPKASSQENDHTFGMSQQILKGSICSDKIPTKTKLINGKSYCNSQAHVEREIQVRMIDYQTFNKQL